MAEREGGREQAMLSVHGQHAQPNEAEIVVSSSSQPMDIDMSLSQKADDVVSSSSQPMEMDMSGEVVMEEEVESLPQTYQASPSQTYQASPQQSYQASPQPTYQASPPPRTYQASPSRQYQASPPVAESSMSASVLQRAGTPLSRAGGQQSYVSTTHHDAVATAMLAAGGYVAPKIEVGSYITPKIEAVETDHVGSSASYEEAMTLPQTSHVRSINLPQTAELRGVVGNPGGAQNVMVVALPETTSVSSHAYAQPGGVMVVTLPQTTSVSSHTYAPPGGVMVVTLPQTSDITSATTLPLTSETLLLTGSEMLPHTSEALQQVISERFSQHTREMLPHTASEMLPHHTSDRFSHLSDRFSSTGEMLPHTSETLPHTSDRFSHHAGETLPHTSETLPPHTNRFSHSTERLPHGMLALKSEVLPHTVSETLSHTMETLPHTSETQPHGHETLPQTSLPLSLTRDVVTVAQHHHQSEVGGMQLHAGDIGSMTTLPQTGDVTAAMNLQQQMDDTATTLPQTGDVGGVVLSEVRSLAPGRGEAGGSHLRAEVSGGRIYSDSAMALPQTSGLRPAEFHRISVAQQQSARESVYRLASESGQLPMGGDNSHSHSLVESGRVVHHMADSGHHMGEASHRTAESGHHRVAESSHHITESGHLITESGHHIPESVHLMTQSGHHHLGTSGDALAAAHLSEAGGRLEILLPGDRRMKTEMYTDVNVSRVSVSLPHSELGQMGVHHSEAQKGVFYTTASSDRGSVVGPPMDVHAMSAQYSDSDVGSRLAVGEVNMSTVQVSEAQAQDYSRIGSQYSSAMGADASRAGVAYTAADLRRLSAAAEQQPSEAGIRQREVVYTKSETSSAGDAGTGELTYSAADLQRLSAAYAVEVARMSGGMGASADASEVDATTRGPKIASGAVLTLPNTGDVGSASLRPPQPQPAREDADRDGESFATTRDAARLSLPPPHADVTPLRIPQPGGSSSAGPVSLPQTADIPPAVQSAPYDGSRVSVSAQPHADETNMRMMAEAAEIISRSTPQADDVNMRLMAETADYISRNVPQSSAAGNTTTTTTTTTAAAGLAQTAEARMTGKQRNSVTLAQTTTSTTAASKSQAAFSSRIDLSARKAGTTVGSKTRAAAEESLSSNSRGKGAVNRASEISSRSGRSSGRSPANAIEIPTSRSSERSSRQKGKGKAGGAKQAGVMKKELKKEEGQGQETDEEYDIIPGFRAEFFQSQSYSRWKQIGMSHYLHSDEEIACFLMKYYDNTSLLIPSGNTACQRCRKQLTVSCVSCLQTAADDSEATEEETDHAPTRKDVAGDDARKQLWKIILEASSKEKEKDKEKETKAKELTPEKSNRRKPTKTRRVLQRSAKADKEPPASPNQSCFSPNVHFEEQSKAATPNTPNTRKRGRPSNASYRLVSTLQCGGCHKKFHTTVGLEKHIKLKRCKLPTPEGGAASEEEEEEVEEETAEEEKDKVKTPTRKSPGAQFRFECADCKKQYRSKQGLMLHKVSKHPAEKHAAVESDGDEGEDTEDGSPTSKEKETKSSTPGILKCPDCEKKYRSKQGLMLHRVSKHSPGPPKRIKVEEAEEGDATVDAKVKGSLLLECVECKKKYSSRPGLMLHIRTKHSPQVLLDCTHCALKFKTKLELRIHIRREHSDGKIILFCPYCPDTFHDRDVLKEHMADKHKSCRQVLYDCFGCDLQFSSRIERKRHIQSEHKGKDTSLTCNFCGQWFATRLEYNEHEKDGHPESNQSWLCATCGDHFPTRYLLQRHALSHKEKVDCELCGKSITEPCFEDHMKRHYGTKTWQCSLCTKSFIRKAELQQHMLVHKDERPFCCELCGVRYREKSRLNSHMRTHAGIKPYRCGQCEKCFTRSRELKNHMRVHTGEKPFSCTVCGRKFASSGNLSAHRRKVHKLSPIPHGQQSRRHMLEERIKYSQQLEQLELAQQQAIAGASTSDLTLPPPLPPSSDLPLAPQDLTPSAAQEAPLAHSAPLAHQAPLAHLQPQPLAAHQAPMAHGDGGGGGGGGVGALYQQQPIAKYEPLVTQPEHYIPQPVIQQPQSSLPIYWPNTSYGDTS